MARTNLTKTTPLGPYPSLPVAANALDAVFAAADVANKNQFTVESDCLVVAWNSGASAYTFTLTSSVDDKNRTGDISAYSIGAGEIAVIRVKSRGWQQSDGYVYLEAENAAVKFAVIAL